MKKEKTNKLKNKKIKQNSKDIGVFFSLFYFIGTVVVCFIVFLFHKQILNISFFEVFCDYVDKTAVLGIVSAINVCVFTTLTLSISIEANPEHFVFGMNPKELNKFLDSPISLASCFIALIVHFCFSLLFLKIGDGLLFYVLSFLSLIYFLISMLMGLPVLSGDSEKAYRKMSELLLKFDDNFKNDSINKILGYLFANGATMTEVINSCLKYQKKDLHQDLKSKIIQAFATFIKDKKTTVDCASSHLQKIKDSLDFFRNNAKDSLFCGCESELASSFFEIYRKTNNSKSFGQMFFTIIFNTFDVIKNENNKTMVNQLFILFLSKCFQTNKIDFILYLKREICLYEFGCPQYSNGRLMFTIVSFLLYSYSLDTKVPISQKNKITLILNNIDKQARYKDLPFLKVFRSLMLGKYDVKTKDFASIINKYQYYFEYEIFGIAYTPMVTKENAQIWFWMMLALSGHYSEITDFIDCESNDDMFLFKKFYEDIKDGNFSQYTKLLAFFNSVGISTFPAFANDFSEKVSSFLAKKGKEQNDRYLAKYKQDDDSSINVCRKAILSELIQLCIGKKQTRAKKETIRFRYIFDNSASTDLNAKCVSYHASLKMSSRIRDIFEIKTVSKNANYISLLEKLFKRKRNKYINTKFKQYCDIGILDKNCLEAISKKHQKQPEIFESQLFENPTCFASRLPYVGQLSLYITKEEVSENDILQAKKECNSGNGFYSLNGFKYIESDFIEQYKNTHFALTIVIIFFYLPPDDNGLVIEPFK